MTTEANDQDLPSDFIVEAKELGVLIEDYKAYPYMGILMVGWDEIHPLVNALLELRQEYLRKGT